MQYRLQDGREMRVADVAFWRKHQRQWPFLYSLVQRIWGIQTSQCVCERLHSISTYLDSALATERTAEHEVMDVALSWGIKALGADAAEQRKQHGRRDWPLADDS